MFSYWNNTIKIITFFLMRKLWKQKLEFSIIALIPHANIKGYYYSLSNFTELTKYCIFEIRTSAQLQAVRHLLISCNKRQSANSAQQSLTNQNCCSFYLWPAQEILMPKRVSLDLKTKGYLNRTGTWLLMSSWWKVFVIGGISLFLH